LSRENGRAGPTAPRLEPCIALRYADRMTQLVTRIDAELAERIDQLVAEGVVESRSDAVRKGLHALLDQTRRRRTAEAIVSGYIRQPQAEDEVTWADRATVGMIADEPW
jgi:Arc/MetJ-type ribon-helix-helix transcriptional regulator